MVYIIETQDTTIFVLFDYVAILSFIALLLVYRLRLKLKVLDK